MVCQNMKRIFRPKTGDLKKKKVFTEIETDFSHEIENSNGFSAQKQVISKNKKVFTEIETDFLGNFKHFFRPDHGNSLTTSLPNPFRGAVFIFRAKIGLKSTKNVRFCIFSGQLGELELPPPRPPCLCYCFRGCRKL